MKRPSKATRGRPAILGKETVMATVRLSVAQARAITKASRKAKKERSQWMRDVLEEAAA
jgi:hypothetical protein